MSAAPLFLPLLLFVGQGDGGVAVPDTHVVAHEDQLRQAIVHLLSSRYPDDAHRLQPTVTWNDVKAPAGEPLRATFAVEPKTLPKGYTKFDLTRTSRQEAVGSAIAFIGHFDSVAIARRDIAAGDLITRDLISTSWMKLNDLAGNPLAVNAVADAATGDHDNASLVARRHIAAGRPIRETDVRRPYDVARGEAVAMHFEHNGFTLSLACKARDHGSYGDVVRLYSSDTRKTYKARLTGTSDASWVETLQR